MAQARENVSDKTSSSHTLDPHIPWRVIDKYFTDNPSALIDHHISSYDDFCSKGIPSILKENNPIVFNKEYDETTQTHKFQCDIHVGGKDGTRVYYGKPVIYDDDKQHFMYPNDARLRNMTYSKTIHYDVELDYRVMGDDGEMSTSSHMIERVFLGRFPIMVGSSQCITNGLADTSRFQLGECKNDRGGYFIIHGKERLIVPQERFADNMMYVRKNPNDEYSHSIDVRCVSEDASKPIRSMSVRMVAPNDRFTNGQIVVNIPNVRTPIPLFIVMRALGVISDTSIIEYCVLNIVGISKKYIDLFVPSVHDAGKVFNQETALKFIASFTKHKTVASAVEIMSDYFLPQVGELNFDTKAYFLGHMVKQMMDVVVGIKEPTDRDSFKYKRVDTTGRLLYDLFNEYYAIQKKEMFKTMDYDYFYDKGAKNLFYFKSLIEKHMATLKKRTVEEGIGKGFKGNWGASANTKREGVAQVLNRLSFNSAISHLRKINLPLDASAKVVGPRHLHGSQFGIIDPVDTPDGGNIGLHKHMAVMARITSGKPKRDMVQWLTKHAKLRRLDGSYPKTISEANLVFVNGSIVGYIYDAKYTLSRFREARRVGEVDTYTSMSWNIDDSVIDVWSDGGRLTRPVFYVDDTAVPSYADKRLIAGIENGAYSWNALVGGGDATSTTSVKSTRALVEYIDTNEQDVAYIAMSPEDITGKTTHTHVEIHPSLMLGVMGNQIVFPENNQLPRDLFSCGQSKQAVSLYHSNYQTRIDKMGVVLNSGQIPLVKSRYTKYISGDEHPYGENVVVAIMCYDGYNVEDSILFNGGSVDRGLFNMTYMNSYESYEESNMIPGNTTNTVFGKIEGKSVHGTKPGNDYSQLDDNGLIRENTMVTEETVVIGRMTTDESNPDATIDASVSAKKGQLGYVDKVYMTEGEEGKRIAKVRVRERRVPSIGDKFCSRCGQKGTVGRVIPEEDMPYTPDGLRPDIIVNPHAFPSRMTIGQLIESLYGKAVAMYGGFGDCTAFVNNGSKHEIYGSMLQDVGFSSSGCHVMYNGMTGEQIESDVYVGPTYYMRLKHMVKDKINFRARGPRTAVTRQAVHGRANDGGLRIGEMERDGVVGHGAMAFLTESMMERGDEYYMAVCNLTGGIAAYNAEQNIFLSPEADGPLNYKIGPDGNVKVDVISRHGRSFSVVRVPYSFKLLTQELQAMNVRMRIITDDNIDQIPQLAFSDNLYKLTGADTGDTVLQIGRQRIGRGRFATNNIKAPASPYVDDMESYSPPTTPDYPPGAFDDSPPYAPDSPPDSPPYAPGSNSPHTPDYPPSTSPPSNSPPYAPTTSPQDSWDKMMNGLPKEDREGLDSSDMELAKKMYYDGKNSTTNGSPPYAPQTPEYPPSPDYPADSPPYAPPDDIPVETTPVEEEVSLLTEIDNATEISDTADSDPSAKKRVTIDI
jgi:DNA-directed RNA polymerase II subunit RPB2